MSIPSSKNANSPMRIIDFWMTIDFNFLLEQKAYTSNISTQVGSRSIHFFHKKTRRYAFLRKQAPSTILSPSLSNDSDLHQAVAPEKWIGTQDLKAPWDCHRNQCKATGKCLCSDFFTKSRMVIDFNFRVHITRSGRWLSLCSEWSSGLSYLDHSR